MMVTFSQHDQVELFGLSTDLKPTKNIPIGSTFEETDTHAKFVYSGTEWRRLTLGRVNSMPYGYDVAEGNISGHTPFLKMGVYSAVGTSEIDIWEGGSVYTWLTAASTISIVSTQANDSAAGSGVRTIYVNYLDSAGVTGRETITMNGTAAVTSVNTMYRINSVVAASTGGALKATGTITLSGTAGGTALAYINAGYNKSRMCIFQVPAGKTLYVTSLTFGVNSANKGCRIIFQSTWDAENQMIQNFFLPYSEVAMPNQTFVLNLDIPGKIPAGSRIKISAIADLAGAYVSAVIRGWIEV